MSIVKIALLLFYIAVSMVTAQPGYYESQVQHIGIINEMRREFAKKFQISNMHEMASLTRLEGNGRLENLQVWDRDVEKRAQVDDIPTHEAMNDWRYHLFGKPYTSKSDMQIWQYMIDEESDKDFRQKIFDEEHKTMYEFEWFLPAQKKFGCSMRLGPTICVLMPELYFASFFEARGTPGSKCDKGYSNNDGLCSLPKKEGA